MVRREDWEQEKKKHETDNAEPVVKGRKVCINNWSSRELQSAALNPEYGTQIPICPELTWQHEFNEATVLIEKQGVHDWK